MNQRKRNLFIYGSLRDSRIFQSVSGFRFARKASKIDSKTLFAEPALLPHYRRVSPDNVYYYAIAAPNSRIEGFVIHDIPTPAMAEIDKYEGKRYERDTVHVNTANGSIEAQQLLAGYCFLLFQRHGTYEAAARRAGLDRRTVKRYVDSWEKNESC